MQQLAPDTARDWRRMKSAAFTDGVEILLVSGFRSVRHQTDLIRRKLSKGVEIARILEVNAAPGFSEHHTGRAVDVATPGTRPLSEDFESSAAFAWLTGHGARFGFTMPTAATTFTASATSRGTGRSSGRRPSAAHRAAAEHFEEH